MEERDYCIEIREVSRTFKSGNRTIRALGNFSARVRSGIVTGLIGPDGAGKTTLMRMVSGLLVPDSGSIEVSGMNSTDDSTRLHSSIGYMPQRFGLYEDLSVQENLDLYADLHNITSSDRKRRYDQLMEMTGLAPFTSRLAGNLSGGMKQKLGLACALINVPRLLILDEPTVGVDPLSRRELWQIVYRQVDEGMSVLLSTSYLDEAERCADVILIHEGEFLGQDRPESFSSPLKGHTFLISPENKEKRRLQEALASDKGVIDAIISGSKIRLVTARPMKPDEVRDNFLIDERFGVESTSPRFEDAFIKILKGKRERADVSDTRLRGLKKGTIETDEAVIKVKGLKRRFGSFYAVKDLNFSVKKGEIFGLLGANGAGKSTTFRMLCGLLPASDGSLMVAGKDLRTSGAEARSNIGYMAQRFSLYPDLSVAQNLKFFSSAYGLSGAYQRERIKWAMDSFQLEALRNAKSADLPLGYKQRLALAAALMHEPSILFLDEPTSGVDPLARREFWRHINGLAQAGVTIMVTTHFMEEAEYCDRIVIMAEGELLAEGTPEKLKAKAGATYKSDPTMEEAFIAFIESHEKKD